MTDLNHAQCNKSEVHSLYNNFDNGGEPRYFMNLKVPLGSKFVHDHNWPRLLNLITYDFKDDHNIKVEDIIPNYDFVFDVLPKSLWVTI